MKSVHYYCIFFTRINDPNNANLYEINGSKEEGRGRDSGSERNIAEIAVIRICVVGEKSFRYF